MLRFIAERSEAEGFIIHERRSCAEQSEAMIVAERSEANGFIIKRDAVVWSEAT